MAGGDSGRLAASQAAASSNSGISRGLVVLPQAVEAPQLALEVAGRLAEALEADLGPVDRVQLDERIDQLVGDPRPLRRAVQRRRDRVGDHLAVDLLHDVERGPDHRRGRRTRPARRGCGPASARARSAGAPRAARRGRWAAAARAAGGAGRRRSTGRRSRWSDRRRPGWRSGRRAPRGRARSGIRSAARARAAARAGSRRPRVGLDDVVGGDGGGHGGVSLPAPVARRSWAAGERSGRVAVTPAAPSGSAAVGRRRWGALTARNAARARGQTAIR